MDWMVMYVWIVINHCPQKEDPNWVCITVGGNLINYPFELMMQTTGMIASKLLWNSTISTKGTRFFRANIKNMYLKTPLDRYEYMCMPLLLILQDIIDQYDLHEKALNSCVYMEIRRECTVSPKPASWPISSYKNTLPTMAITNSYTHQDSGNTKLIQLGSTLQSTTLASSTSGKDIYNTSTMPSARKPTRLSRIPSIPYTVV